MASLNARAYGQPLSIICLARAEQSFQRVVAWNKEACEVDKELARDIKKDQEEVDSDEAEESIDFRHGGLPLEVVEHLIFGELYH